MKGTLAFGGSPWARNAMWQDTERSDALRLRASGLGVGVSVVGHTAKGRAASQRKEALGVF